jgi:hypothetical protein
MISFGILSRSRVAMRLGDIQGQIDDTCEVRLQVYESGEWAVRWGSADYDQDHLGYWGASFLSPTDTASEITALAQDLIDQVSDQQAFTALDIYNEKAGF